MSTHLEFQANPLNVELENPTHCHFDVNKAMIRVSVKSPFKECFAINDVQVLCLAACVKG